MANQSIVIINAKSVKAKLVIFGEGLDLWDLEIKSINELREKFEEFQKRRL